MSFCIKCGAKVEGNFCSNCGYKVDSNPVVERSNLNSKLVCPMCGSNNVSIQMISESRMAKKGRGLLYWLFIGWWLEIWLWTCFFFIRFLIWIFGSKRQKIVNDRSVVKVCQNCGKTWH